MIKINLLSTATILGLLVAVLGQTNVLFPDCDSPEAEEVALVAQDFLNGQHTHGYKYVLNRIEDIKVHTKPDGDNTYVMEVDLLETDCHVLDPTPLANCTVRPKQLTAVEGDCDVVLRKVGGILTVTAFKCKTEESTEDLCLGCPTLLPLNDTNGLDFVYTSLGNLNNRTENITFTLLEVGRMTSQVVSGGPRLTAEYVVVEANCTADPCVPLDDIMAARGLCTVQGSNTQHTVDCKMYPIMVPVVDANSTAAPVLPPSVHVHMGSLSRKHGLKYHKLTTLHNPELTGLLSAESAESEEVVPVVPVAAVPVADTAVVLSADPTPAANPVPVVQPASSSDSGSASDASQSAEVPLLLIKRDVSGAPASVVADATATQAGPVQVMPLCPGRVRFF